LPSFSPIWARLGRYTVLILVGFLLLWLAAWKGWLIPSDRQVLPRIPDPTQVAVPAGYRVELLATGLNAPSALEVTTDGAIYIAESGYGGAYAATAGYEGTTPGRILQLLSNGSLRAVAGDFHPPMEGFVHDKEGNLFVSHSGTITAITAKGRRDILTGLPSIGDHKNNNVTLGPDGKLYFAQGTATNSGVVGLDNWVLWGRYFPGPHDIPCQNLILRGVNTTTADPRSVIPFMRVQTGAFSSFGQVTVSGQVIRSQLPCNGAIMRLNPDGSGLELVASGMRNPFDLRFGKDGQLYVTDNGPDTRGSRPMEGPDLFYKVQLGAWYGWPDFWNQQPASSLGTSGREKPAMLLERLPGKPAAAYATFGLHMAAAGFDFAPSTFGYDEQAFVAQWGSAFPATNQNPTLNAGYNIARLNLLTRKVEVFAHNKQVGPASLQPSRGGFERPVQVRFGPDGAMYVLDWGHLSVTRKGPFHVPDSGALWRIVKEGTTALPYRPLLAAAR
jgi:glucose/arabinose dehydrogenase